MAQRLDELPLHALQHVLALALEGFSVDVEARVTGVCEPTLQQLASVSRAWNSAMLSVAHAHKSSTHAFRLERYVTEYIVHYPSGHRDSKVSVTAGVAGCPESAPSSLLAKSVAGFFSSIVGKIHAQHAFPWEEGDAECAVAPPSPPAAAAAGSQDDDVPETLLSAPEELDAALEAFLMSELSRLTASLQGSWSANPAKLRELILSESDFGFSINSRHEDSLQSWDALQLAWHGVFSMVPNLQRLDLSNTSLLSVHMCAILIAASTHCKGLKALVLPQQECLGYKRRNVKPVFDALYAALENWYNASVPKISADDASSSSLGFMLPQHRQRGLRRLVMPKLFAYEFYDEHMTTIARFCPLLEHVDGLRLAPIFQARGLSHIQVMSSWIHAWESFCNSCVHLNEWNWFEIPFVDEFFAIFAAQRKRHIHKLTLPGNTTLWKRDYVYQEHQEPTNCVCTPRGMKTILQACPNLRTLEVLFSDRHLMFGNENPFLIGDEFLLEVIRACPQIETLRLTEVQARHGFEKTNTISSGGILALAKLQRLQTVELSGVEFNASALLALAAESRESDGEMPRRRVRATVGVRGIKKSDIAASFSAILSELLGLLIEDKRCERGEVMSQFVIELQIDTANHQLPVHWATPFRPTWTQMKRQLAAQRAPVSFVYDLVRATAVIRCGRPASARCA